MWTPEDSVILVWDTYLEYKLLIYNTVGTLIARHVPYENALGIKTVSLSPDGLLCSIGSYDQQVRIFGYLSWQQITEFPHRTRVGDEDGLQIYKEEEYQETSTTKSARYATISDGITLKAEKVKQGEAGQPIGVSICEWSCDSRFLATRCDTTPGAVWIWDMTSLSLATLMEQEKPIRSMAWSPKTLHFAFCTGTPRFFLWSEQGASVCDVPFENTAMNVMKLKWSPDGHSLTLMEKNRAKIAYPQFDYLEVEDDEIELY